MDMMLRKDVNLGVVHICDPALRQEDQSSRLF